MQKGYPETFFNFFKIFLLFVYTTIILKVKPLKINFWKGIDNMFDTPIETKELLIVFLKANLYDNPDDEETKNKLLKAEKELQELLRNEYIE